MWKGGNLTFKQVLPPPFPKSRFAQKKNHAYVGEGFGENTFSKTASLGGLQKGNLLFFPDSLESGSCSKEKKEAMVKIILVLDYLGPTF